MENKFNFNNLIILDLANNHQGSVHHAKNIIEQLAKTVAEFDFKFAFKFQFRDLPTFIHKSEIKSPKNKHVPRFLETMLTWEDFKELKEFAAQHGFLTICTPFDEASVDKIEELEFDLLKIASCSAADWPLLTKASSSGLPMVVSTGGLEINQVDKLVSFLQHAGNDFSLMHCVGVYPTPPGLCNLLDITYFKQRYSSVHEIGWSTHEEPENIHIVKMAKALGATMFERHVGLETEELKLNAYSSSPAQIYKWLKAIENAQNILGTSGRLNINQVEKKSLNALARGTFLKSNLSKGHVLQDEDVYFAFPLAEESISSGEFRSGLTLDTSVKKDMPLKKIDLQSLTNDEKTKLDSLKVIKNAIHEVKAMLNLAKIVLPNSFSTEYSHHAGIANFYKIGATMITILNRQYCKKLIIQLPGQWHPYHYHKIKEETFFILHGDLTVTLDGNTHNLKKGDTLLIQPGVWHSFNTTKGCIFEEISTTHLANDSFYKDPKIKRLTNEERKTIVDHWGRFQLKNQLL